MRSCLLASRAFLVWCLYIIYRASLFLFHCMMVSKTEAKYDRKSSFPRIILPFSGSNFYWIRHVHGKLWHASLFQHPGTGEDTFPRRWISAPTRCSNSTIFFPVAGESRFELYLERPSAGLAGPETPPVSWGQSRSPPTWIWISIMISS